MRTTACPQAGEHHLMESCGSCGYVIRPLRWWHRWFPPYSRVYDHCPETPDGQHETREVCGVGAAGFECYQECVHCGRFW